MQNFQLRGSAVVAIACVIALLLVISTVAGFGPSSKHFLTSATQGLQHDILDDTQNATLGFQKILVINLPSRTDHRDSMALAASLTGLEIEFIDGVTHVEEKTLPPGADSAGLRAPELGNWRAHLNAVRYVVENNIQSALILEDDIDWDLRIKDIMRNFAKASNLLVQPISASSNLHLDPTWPDGEGEAYTNLYVHQQHAMPPVSSPYGDLKNWDILGVGHCGVEFPRTEHGVPIGRAVILNDETVPEPQHIEMQFGDHQLRNNYPAHTRVVARSHEQVCSLGYGISLQGARRLLYTLSIVHQWGPTDIDYRRFCDGDAETGVTPHVCLTPQPQIFQHHRPVRMRSSFSDISDHPDKMNEQAFTRNIRWSVRLNMDKLLEGQTDYIDLYQDGAPPHDYGWG